MKPRNNRFQGTKISSVFGKFSLLPSEKIKKHNLMVPYWIETERGPGIRFLDGFESPINIPGCMTGHMESVDFGSPSLVCT